MNNMSSIYDSMVGRTDRNDLLKEKIEKVQYVKEEKQDKRIKIFYR